MFHANPVLLGKKCLIAGLYCSARYSPEIGVRSRLLSGPLAWYVVNCVAFYDPHTYCDNNGNFMCRGIIRRITRHKNEIWKSYKLRDGEGLANLP